MPARDALTACVSVPACVSAAEVGSLSLKADPLALDIVAK